MIIDFKKIWATVQQFFAGLKSETHEVLIIADTVLNKLKAFEGTELGQFIEQEIEPLIPGLGVALHLWMPEAFKLLNWAIAETGKTGDQLALEGLEYLKNIPDADTKAAQHNTGVALIGRFIGTNTGAALTIQQHLIAAQVVHNPEVVNS